MGRRKGKTQDRAGVLRFLNCLVGRALPLNCPRVKSSTFRANGVAYGIRYIGPGSGLLISITVDDPTPQVTTTRHFPLRLYRSNRRTTSFSPHCEVCFLDIRALEFIPYDLVLMDMRMPVMDGIEATRQIRKPQSRVLNRDIPVIAMTANAMQSDQDSCTAAGMNDFVSKPVSKRLLRDALKRWLRSPDAEPTVPEQSLEPRAGQSEAILFDRAGVLLRLEGDNQLAQIIFEAFLEDIPGQIQALKDFVKSGGHCRFRASGSLHQRCFGKCGRRTSSKPGIRDGKVSRRRESAASSW
jgi:CheY-like chemotaxis protein